MQKKRTSMLIEIPDWLANKKEINRMNCKFYYKEKLSKKLGIGDKISLDQLTIEVQKAGIKSRREYYQKRKPCWPSKPEQHYKNEWIDWYDLFGRIKTERISLKKLRVEVKKAGIEGQIEYRQKRKPSWPSNPRKYYKDEWINWYDLFGKKKIDISLKQLKKDAEKAGIKSQKEYKQKRKPNWPSNPDQYYQVNWTNWRDFLGKKKIHLKQLKKEVKKEGIKSQKEYESKRKSHWPSDPNQYCKDEWIDWYDFLGK